MTTALEIITQAYRDPNIIAVGKQPTASELSEAIPLLNTILKNVFGRKLGNFVEDWPVGTYYTAPDHKQFPFWDDNSTPPKDVWAYPPQNTRLLVRLLEPTRVYFEPYPDDGAQMVVVDNGNDWATNPLTLDFNGRTASLAGVRAASHTITAAPTSPIHWVYRADLSSWEQVPTLEATGGGSETMPLPAEFDDWFSISLAMRLAPRYSKKIDPLLIAALQDLEQQMETRFRQSARVSAFRKGEAANTVQTYGSTTLTGGIF